MELDYFLKVRGVRGATGLLVGLLIFQYGCKSPTVVRSDDETQPQQTLAGPPARVTTLAVSDVSQTSATVTWTEVSDGNVGPANYVLRRGSPTISWGSAVAGEVEVAGTSVGEVASHTWTGLTPATDYQFELVAYRGDLNDGAVFSELSNVASTTTLEEDQSVARIVASPATLLLTGIGDFGTVTGRAETAGGQTVSGVSFYFESTDPAIADVDSSGQVISAAFGGASIVVTSDACACSDTTSVVVQDAGTPSTGSNEPAGFTSIYDEPWENFQRYRYWTSDGTQGTVEANGTLTWTYPPGFPGGYVPESRIIRLNTPNHGPYQYQRDEGVILSDNWRGHGSGVNKYRFWTRTNEEIHGYLMFEGTGSNPLRPAINTQGFPFPVAVWRWDDADNLANPTEQQTHVTRGVPHTVETLMYKGTPGNADGWVKVWLDGVLILHFVNKQFCRTGESPEFGPIHFAPYWGGVGSSLNQTQTLSVGYSYASWGSSVP
jgi:hypothetical protein